MCLFNFVEQYDGIGLAPYRLGELSALVVTDISGRRADEPRNGILFHVFAHVDTDHILFVVEQSPRERFCELRLTHAGRAEEKERPDRPPGVGNSRTGAQNGVRHGVDGLILPHDSLMQSFGKAEEFLAFPFHELGHGDSSPASDDTGDFLFRHAVPKESGIFGGSRRFFALFQFFFQLRNLAVLQFGGGFEVVFSLRLFELRICLFELLPNFLNLADRIFLVVPFALHFRVLSAQGGELLLRIGEVRGGKIVRLLFEGVLLDFELHDLSGNLIHFCRHGLHFRLDHGASLVDEVNGLVGQETVGDVTIG